MCLYLRKSTKGVAHLALHIFDNSMTGNSEAIDKVLEQLKKNGLMQKVSKSLQGYLLCEIQFSKDKKSMAMTALSVLESRERSLVDS